jgi:large subunit ribosomal protein L25
LEHVNNTIEVEAEATAIPAFLELDMTGLMAGESKYAADVVLPAGITLVSDLKMTVVHLSVRAAQEEEVVVAPVEGDAAAATAAAPAEGEAAKEEKK